MNRRRAWWGLAGAALAALTGVAGARLLRRPAPAALLAAALPPSRALEARLSHPALSAHRPYSVDRGGPPHAQLPLPLLARLEDEGDFQALGGAYLLSGDPAQAARALAKATASPAVRQDLAALSLAKGDPEEALLQLAEMGEGPGMAFNRGLALRELGLPMSAAAQLDAAAGAGEPGWSEEARERAAALRTPAQARGASWNALRKAALGLLDGGPLPPPESVRAHPGLARLSFYDALRAAPDAQRARALRPLAEELDRLAGEPGLAASVDATAAADFRVRAPLAAQYALLVRGKLPGAEKQALLAAAKAKGAQDILLGALFIEGVPAAWREEFIARASATGDRWFQLAAQHVRAEAALAGGDFPRAERVLLDALAGCDGRGVEYRCIYLELELGRQYARLHRLPEARRRSAEGLQRAVRAQEWALELRFLEQLSQLARFRLSVPLALAYLDETALREPQSCTVQRYRYESLSLLHRLAVEPDQVRADADAAPGCGKPPTLYGGVEGRVFLYRQQRRAQDAELARQALAAHRAGGKLKPGEALHADFLEGALTVVDDAQAGRARLQAVIAAAELLPRHDVEARIARAGSYAMLTLAALREGDDAGAFATLADEAGAGRPAGCALAVASLEDTLVALAMDREGRVGRASQVRRRGLEVNAADVLTPSLLAQLEGCPEVAVLAKAPLHGRAGLLPPQLAWSYTRGGAARQVPARAPAVPLRVVIHDVQPPAELKLPQLLPWRRDEGAAMTLLELSGAAATPSRALEAMREADEVEVHAHGLVNLGVADESLVVLSPEADGRYALTAGAVRTFRFTRGPIVWLASCRAAQTAPFVHEPWSLPVSFLEAGARAVFASPENLPDAEVGALVAAVRAGMLQGKSAAVALRDARQAFLARPGGRWVEAVLLFQ